MRIIAINVANGVVIKSTCRFMNKSVFLWIDRVLLKAFAASQGPL